MPPRIFSVGEAARTFGVGHWIVRGIVDAPGFPPVVRFGLRRVLQLEHMQEIRRQLIMRGFIAEGKAIEFASAKPELSHA
jgi:hypothetical protein